MGSRGGGLSSAISSAGGIVLRSCDALTLANKAVAREWVESLSTSSPSVLWIKLFPSSTDKGTSREQAAARAISDIVSKAMRSSSVLLMAPAEASVLDSVRISGNH